MVPTLSLVHSGRKVRACSSSPQALRRGVGGTRVQREGGQLLRYVVRVEDGPNVNVQLVRVGAAAPYFYLGRPGRYANLLEWLDLRARANRLGLWGRCPHTPYDPTRGVSTRS
jgi:endonuclease YncB( thermonuclease family)